MGFNLQMFINELYEILGENVEAVQKVRTLEEAIKAGAEYAAQCGLIELHK